MKSIIRIAQTLTALVLAITAAPVGALTATTTSGNGQIALSWTVEAGATAYRVEHATTSGGPYAELASGLTVTTYTHTGVEDTELLHGYFDNVSLKPLHLTTLVVIR